MMGCLGICQAGAYPLHVLCCLVLTYLLNQLDRYLLAIVIQPLAQDIQFGEKSCLPRENDEQIGEQCHNASSQDSCLSLLNKNKTQYCQWTFDGSGWEYQVMAGPVFIFVFTFTGIFIGFVADSVNRKNFLSASLFLWSLMTLLMGFAKHYWHLVILRFGQGISEAGCTPFAVSLIMDYFPKESRGSAMGFYNWGIYAGYSLSYAVGNYVTEANILGQGWRWSFIVGAIPGFIVSVIVLLSVRELPKEKVNTEATRRGTLKLIIGQKILLGLRPFIRPSLLLLCIAGSVRNAGGYVWAYNTQLFFNLYHTGVDVGCWLSWIPLVGGCLGALSGGLISDQLVKQSGIHARVWVLVVSQVAAAPFVAGAIWLNPPYCFLSLIPANIMGKLLLHYHSLQLGVGFPEKNTCIGMGMKLIKADIQRDLNGPQLQMVLSADVCKMY
ncbi:probable anion transporter 3, chloroplastic [Chiloscyllium plagiosum]|uniref:probable anion transporter 3, chloroplastic n=1 Tax=Chiloscyllium plagiosum TaxID=36176 RepID=UPI001CB81812|nr:probable anion transporter 3, chloroplastic [Chiloscyllium plagiosum]